MTALQDACAALTQAAERRNRADAWGAVGTLLPLLADLTNTVDPAAAYQLVWSGARWRWFDIAEVVAAAFANRVDATPRLRRLHAQMLMERGLTHEALARLEGLLASQALDPRNRSEALGHVGRIHKDRFLAHTQKGDPGAAQAALHLSIEAYSISHREKLPDWSWHAINAAALLARPEARTLDSAAADKAEQLAAEVQAEILTSDPQLTNLYAAATLAEAALARGDMKAVLDWLRRYVGGPSVNAFALGATLRQFQQVWRLGDRESPGPELIDMLRAAMLDRSNAAVSVSRDDVTRALSQSGMRYEAVFGGDRFQSLLNYRRGLERCACVARIGRTASDGVGTGFLMPAKQLSSKYEDGLVLVTNAHVISTSDALRKEGALHPAEAVVTFEALEKVSASQEFHLGDVLYTSPPEALDVSVVSVVEQLPAVAPIPFAPVLPVRGAEQKVRIVGHPSGRGMSFSVNDLVDHESPKVHYMTATEGGSSGSPVFNADWNLVALHHAGGEKIPKLNQAGGTYAVNEGIWIGAILNAIEAK